MKRKALPTILIKIHRIKFINSIHKQHQYIPIFVLTYYTTPPPPENKRKYKDTTITGLRGANKNFRQDVVWTFA